MKTATAFAASALLFSACVPPSLVVPSQAIPHQLASACRAEVLVTAPGGQVERQKVTIPAGWWVASPQIVGGD